MNLDDLQSRLGYDFRDAALLREAMTHPSVHRAGKPEPRDNQRLEFFGDAVLQLIASLYLFEQLPHAREGDLTKIRSRLTSRSTLARLGRTLGLGEFLDLGRGEETSGGRSRARNLADAFEAVVAAIYLDGGLEAATRFALTQWQTELGAEERPSEIENPKGRLQEILQARAAAGPTYKITRIAGPDHAREFEAVAEFGGEELGRGTGKSKKEAEMNAARKALAQLGRKEAEK